MNNKSSWTPVRGWESPAEQGLLSALATTVPLDGSIVEIGSEHGMSASIWVQYSKAAMITCIEINPKSEFLKNLRDAEISTKRIDWLLGSSQDVAIPTYLLERGTDLLFIDGDHSYDGAKADLDRWSQHVNQNGIILVHDCACSTNKQPHEQHYAVYSAVQNFLAESGEWRVAFSVDTTMVLVRI